MAVHNGEPFLEQAINSILGQTFRNFELLIVEDASTDNSARIVTSFDDPRIRILINSRNLGLTPSLNRGIAEARAPLLARHDADDISEPTRLQRQITRFDADPQLALLSSSYVRIDESGAKTALRQIPTSCTAIRWRLLFLNVFTHSSVTMRTEVVLRAGLYDERYRFAQDYDLWSRIARMARVEALVEPLVRYRRTPQSMSATFPGAAAEVDAISRRNIELVAAGHIDAERIRDDDVRAARSLLFGTTSGMTPARGDSAGAAALILHRAFCDFYGIEGREASYHRARVAWSAGTRLMRPSLLSGDMRGAATAFRLLAQAPLAVLAKPTGSSR